MTSIPWLTHPNTLSAFTSVNATGNVVLTAFHHRLLLPNVPLYRTLRLASLRSCWHQTHVELRIFLDARSGERSAVRGVRTPPVAQLYVNWRMLRFQFRISQKLYLVSYFWTRTADIGYSQGTCTISTPQPVLHKGTAVANANANAFGTQQKELASQLINLNNQVNLILSLVT